MRRPIVRVLVASGVRRVFEQAIQSAHISSENKLWLQKMREHAGAQVIGYVGLISFKRKHNYRGWALEK